MQNTFDSIALIESVFASCSRLPKSSKLQEFEWSVLASVVLERTTNLFEPITIGSGTKCLGKCDLTCTGGKLTDSHGEIVALRTFRLALLREVMAHMDNCNMLTGDCKLNGAILTHSPYISVGVHHPIFNIREGYRIHLYISESPCGAATIYHTWNDLWRHFFNDNVAAPAAVDSDSALESNSRQTGAKRLHLSSDPDIFDGSLDESLRTKPGRTDLPEEKRTLSLSCSDKLARQVFLGIQGHMLSHFLVSPIFLSSVVVSGDVFPAPPKQLVNEENHIDFSMSELFSHFSKKYYDHLSASTTSPQALALKFALFDRLKIDSSRINSPQFIVNHSLSAQCYLSRFSRDSILSSGSVSIPVASLEPPDALHQLKKKKIDLEIPCKKRKSTPSGFTFYAYFAYFGKYHKSPVLYEVVTGILGLLNGAKKVENNPAKFPTLCRLKTSSEFEEIWRKYSNMWGVVDPASHGDYYGIKNCVHPGCVNHQSRLSLLKQNSDSVFSNWPEKDKSYQLFNV